MLRPSAFSFSPRSLLTSARTITFSSSASRRKENRDETWNNLRSLYHSPSTSFIPVYRRNILKDLIRITTGRKEHSTKNIKCNIIAFWARQWCNELRRNEYPDLFHRETLDTSNSVLWLALSNISALTGKSPKKMEISPFSLDWNFSLD